MCLLHRVVYSIYHLLLTVHISFISFVIYCVCFRYSLHSPVQAEVRTLTDQLESVKQDLLSEKQKNQLYQVTASPADGPSGHSDRLVTLEMKELNERQRADLATTR